MQKRSIVTSFVLPAIVIFSVIILLVNNQRELPGELILEPEKIDFGEVPEWEGSVTQSVTGRNIGKSPVVIGRIQPGSSYAKIEGPEVIPPGEEKPFQVVLNPGAAPDDAKASTAILFTDSRKTPQVYLTIAAAAKRFATLSATICDFGEVERNTVHEKKVKLCVNAPMKVADIRLMPPSPPMLKWNLEPERSSGCFLIKVTLGPVKAAGPFSSVLTIAFPNERTLTLSVAARGVRPVSVQPETVFYGTVAPGDDPTTEFRLTAKKPFRIMKVQTPTVLSIVNLPDNASQTHTTMEVKWQTRNSPAVLREQIQVVTDAEAEPLRIPVYGLVRSDTAEPMAEMDTARTQP